MAHFASDIKAFNTHRGYSAKGQRIAYCVLSTGNIAMFDIDRGIDYILVRSDPSLPFAGDSAVLALYDRNQTQRKHIQSEYAEARSVQAALQAAAEALRTLTEGRW